MMTGNKKVAASQTRKTAKDSVRVDGKQKEAHRRVQDALEDDEVRKNLERLHKHDKGG
jgi:hypothetical protein